MQLKTELNEMDLVIVKLIHEFIFTWIIPMCMKSFNLSFCSHKSFLIPHFFLIWPTSISNNPSCGSEKTLCTLSALSASPPFFFLPLCCVAQLCAPGQAGAPGSPSGDVPAYAAQPGHPRTNGSLLHAGLEPRDHRHLRSDWDGPR